METVADNEIVDSLGLPTATPALDVLRPLPHPEAERLSTGGYFFVSSAVIIAFTELPHIRAFVDTISHGPLAVFWISLLALPLLTFFLAVAMHHAGHLVAARMTGFEVVRIKVGPFTIREKLEATDVLSLGFVVLRPRRAERLRRRLCYLVLAGPLASLLLPLPLDAALRLAQDRWGTLRACRSSRWQRERKPADRAWTLPRRSGRSRGRRATGRPRCRARRPRMRRAPCQSAAPQLRP